MGSALLSDEEMRFRNLGGSAVQHAALVRSANCVLLTTSSDDEKLPKSAGMIIQHFDFEVLRLRPAG